MCCWAWTQILTCFFWSFDRKRREIADSLKTLLKENPDIKWNAVRRPFLPVTFGRKMFDVEIQIFDDDDVLQIFDDDALMMSFKCSTMTLR